jgi:dGTPase
MSNSYYIAGDWRREVPVEQKASWRTPFRQDFARLIHSPSFRRLQGKTQLFPCAESDFFRNRLTHSLEVAQIAKSIALRFNDENRAFRKAPIDTDLVEFAALAHDLGHPPFGHNGEHALDRLMHNSGGFEGNAQTLRILCRLEKRTSGGDHETSISADGKDQRVGLNLTYRSLASILKYNEEIPISDNKRTKPKKGYYASESQLVKRLQTSISKTAKPFRVTECEIMDLADDIAYSTYDLEDSFKGEFQTPLSILLALRKDIGLGERVAEKVSEAGIRITRDEVIELVEDIFQFADAKTSLVSDTGIGELDAFLVMYGASRGIARDSIARVAFTSGLVNEFIQGVEVSGEDKNPAFARFTFSEEVLTKVETLKHLNYELMIASPRLAVVHYRGAEVVEAIFQALASKGGHDLLPEDFRRVYDRLTNNADKDRVICDFVAGMTDRYAIEFHSRLRGSGETIFKPF